MMSNDFEVTWIDKRLRALPPQADAALFLRHAERNDIWPGTFGQDVPLTPQGIVEAERLGAMLSASGRQLCATASPVPRCADTARAIMRGAGRPEEQAALDWRLGEPGPFVVDEQLAGALFLNIGILEIARRQLTGAEPPLGMRPTAEGIDLLLGLAASPLSSDGRLCLYVTHDGILAVLVAFLYRLPIDAIPWPGYLDGLLLWQHGEFLWFVWPGLSQRSRPLRG